MISSGSRCDFAESKPTEPCFGPVDRGTCDGAERRFAFNPKTKRCQPFPYSGCGGNENNFTSRKDCFINCIRSRKGMITKRVPKCMFHRLIAERCRYNVAALFCRRSREEDDPNKEEKHQRHCSPLSLKTLDLWSHPYLCPYFIVSFTHICGFVVLLYLTCISFVAPECNYHYPHYFHISH